MTKKYIPILFLIGLHTVCLAQKSQLNDSIATQRINTLMQRLVHAKNDSDKIIAMEKIGFFYERLAVDSSLKYYNAGLDLARKKSYAWGEARLLAGLSGLMEHQGKYAEEFELLFKSLKIAMESKSAYDIARANRRISGVYFELQNYPKAIEYLLMALHVDEVNLYKDKVAIDHYALADAYEKINQLDSAAYHVNIALQQTNLLKSLIQYVYEIDGHIKQKKGYFEQAIISYRKGFEEAQLSSDLLSYSQLSADVSDLYRQLNLRDSAIYYALNGFNYAKVISYKKGIMLNGYLLAGLYDSIQPSLAFKYFKIATAAKDSLFGVNTTQAIQNLVTKEETRQKELEDAQASYQNKLRLYGLLTGIIVLLSIAFILYRNNRHKQKVNKQLEQQKETLQKTLSELKSAQAQLIQSEKMASLGELTSGIAHEIQNPLNFVNNFSDLSAELIDEMKSELATGNQQEAIEIADDLKQNLEKINHHGKRADAIVKGMLEHSKASTGKKELADINKLADEYLKLSYHGLRAKDKEFNATMKTDFDTNIGKINIIPQDIGRVLLNLFNNAFYACTERSRSTVNDTLRQPVPIHREAQGDIHYEPTVSVTTKKTGNHIIITVSDNGNGIPQNLIGKIFQPFFTTKPTGQGTGLGLSLSYDIIRAHGGEIKVESKENKGTEFIAVLPVS